MKKIFFFSIIFGLFFSLIQDINQVSAQENEEPIKTVTATRISYVDWDTLSYYGDLRVNSSQEVIDQFIKKEAVLQVEVDNGIDPYVSFLVPIEIAWNFDEIDFTEVFWYLMSGVPIVPEKVYCEELNADVLLTAPQGELLYRILVIDADKKMDIYLQIDETDLYLTAQRISGATKLSFEYSMDGGENFYPWKNTDESDNLLEGITHPYKNNSYTFNKVIDTTESPFKEYYANEIDSIIFRFKVEGGTYDGYSEESVWPYIDEAPPIPKDEPSEGGRNDDGDNPTGNIPEPEPTIMPTVKPTTRPVFKPNPQEPEKKTWNLKDASMPLWIHFSLEDTEATYQEIHHLILLLRKILFR